MGRVKSLVRELEANDGPAPGTGNSNANGSGQQIQTTHTRKPSLHTRGSTSSISSMTGGSDTLQSTFGSDVNANGKPLLDAASFDSYAGTSPTASTSNISSSYSSSTSATAPPPPTTPQLQQEEEDEFLPMTSPFSPSYSMSMYGANGTSPVRGTHDRRGSGTSSSNPGSLPQSPIGQTSMAGMTAAERREHSRRHSRVHSRNLSVFFPRPEQKGLPGYQLKAVQFDEQDEQADRQHSVNVDITGARTKGWGFANGAPAPIDTGDESTRTNPQSRRGHHHRHSMSHKCVIPQIVSNAVQLTLHSHIMQLLSLSRQFYPTPYFWTWSARSRDRCNLPNLIHWICHFAKYSQSSSVARIQYKAASAYSLRPVTHTFTIPWLQILSPTCTSKASVCTRLSFTNTNTAGVVYCRRGNRTRCESMDSRANGRIVSSYRLGIPHYFRWYGCAQCSSSRRKRKRYRTVMADYARSKSWRQRCSVSIWVRFRSSALCASYLG